MMAKVMARVEIVKSFDDGRKLSKEWSMGDLKKFFDEEGEYLDKLAKVTEEHGKPGNGYAIAYMVIVTKED